jgi:hypothetical protein
MNNRFTNTIIAMVAAATLHEAAAKEAANHPYVSSGPDGVFYARCIPAAATGGSGLIEHTTPFRSAQRPSLCPTKDVSAGPGIRRSQVSVSTYIGPAPRVLSSEHASQL